EQAKSALAISELAGSVEVLGFDMESGSVDHVVGDGGAKDHGDIDDAGSGREIDGVGQAGNSARRRQNLRKAAGHRAIEEENRPLKGVIDADEKTRPLQRADGRVRDRDSQAVAAPDGADSGRAVDLQ